MLNYKYKRITDTETGKTINTITKDEFSNFNAKVLGLGDIEKQGKYIQSIVAIFDLEGFTSFCNQFDSHLVIPLFLKEYLDWFFTNLANKFREKGLDPKVTEKDRVAIWGSLPMFAKFLGDGILLIWNTEYTGGDQGIRNVIGNLNKIVEDYPKEFYPKISQKVSKA